MPILQSKKIRGLLLISLAVYFCSSFLLFLNPPTAEASNFPYWGDKGILPCLAYGDVRCNSWCNVLQLFQNLSYLIFTYILLAATPAGLIYGGAAMMTSGGSEKRYTHGKKVITFCIKWAVITFMVWAIFNFTLSLGWLKLNDGSASSISWPDITCTTTTGSGGEPCTNGISNVTGQKCDTSPNSPPVKAPDTNVACVGGTNPVDGTPCTPSAGTQPPPSTGNTVVP